MLQIRREGVAHVLPFKAYFCKKCISKCIEIYIYMHIFKKDENVVYLLSVLIAIEKLASRWQKLPLLGFFFPNPCTGCTKKRKVLVQ